MTERRYCNICKAWIDIDDISADENGVVGCGHCGESDIENKVFECVQCSSCNEWFPVCESTKENFHKCGDEEFNWNDVCPDCVASKDESDTREWSYQTSVYGRKG